MQVHSLIHGFIHVTVWRDRREQAIAALNKLMEIGSDIVPLGQGHLMCNTYLQAFRAKRFLKSEIVLSDGALAKFLPFKRFNTLAADERDQVS